MKINRLFNIVYILLEKKSITAKELAEQLEVSTRTIYRDIDILSSSGIPIYANQGKGGGIALLDNFILDKFIISEDEQNEILMGLQSLKATKFLNTEEIMKKMASIFKKKNYKWIDVDFSYWYGDKREKEIFDSLRYSVLNSYIAEFDYYNSNCEKNKRNVCPLRLKYKGISWYLQAYDNIKKDYRTFKICRIQNLKITNNLFDKNLYKVPDKVEFLDSKTNMVNLKLKFENYMAYRIYDSFNCDEIIKNEDNTYTVTIKIPESNWLYDYIFSFGSGVEVLEPISIRNNIFNEANKIISKYK